MNDPHFRIEYDDRLGVHIRWTRFIEDNDRGDEDPSERPAWSIHGTVLDPVTMQSPVHSIVFEHTVKNLTRSELALQLRVQLLSQLAPDRRCAHCKRFIALEYAEIDHPAGRTWCGRRLNFLDRIRRQWQEWRSGVELWAACRRCNARDGARLRGRRRYQVAYR